MQKTSFGKTKEGKEVTKYTIGNKNGMTLCVLDLGATIQALCVPDASGKSKDVVLGYDNPIDYQTHTCYFGALIGRNANRIANASYMQGDRKVMLEANDNGNSLHSGSHGFHAKIWDVKEQKESEITFSLLSPDGEQGFPGNMQVEVTYALDDDNALSISYHAVSDADTVANMTNHAYFNLNGHDSGNMENQLLEILATYYTPIKDSKAIPTGEIASVAGTPMDFRKPKKIGADIAADFDQLKAVGGYDHNYVLDKADDSLQLAARALSTESGIAMDVYTDCVGMQLYAGNFIGKQQGKDGVIYDDRNAFCLETQYFPNAANEEAFRSPFLKKGETYHSVTKYCFRCASKL